MSISLPFISVITPVFNRREAVIRSIRSSIAFISSLNTHSEIILVDDASTDDVINYVTNIFSREIDQCLLRIICLRKNVGVTAAKQAGVEAARGEWLVFMDSDDVFVDNSHEFILDSLSSTPNDCPAVFFRCVDTSNGTLVGNKQAHDINLTVRDFLRFGTPGECLPVIRRAAFNEEQFDTDLRGFEGLTYARMARRFGFLRVSPVVVRGYCSDSTGDRLSTRQAVRKRGCLLARGYLRMWLLFYRELGGHMFLVLAKILYHSINCIFFTLSKDGVQNTPGASQ